MIIMKKNPSGKYLELEEDTNFKSGYLLVDETLYLFNKRGSIEESFDVSGESIKDMVSDGRRQAEIDGRTPVYVDTERIYDSDIIDDNGRLVTAEEAFDDLSEENQEDYMSYAENCNWKY